MPYWSGSSGFKLLWFEPQNWLHGYNSPRWHFGGSFPSVGDIVIVMSNETPDICPTNGNIEEANWVGNMDWTEPININQYVHLECKAVFKMFAHLLMIFLKMPIVYFIPEGDCILTFHKIEK